MTLSIGRFGGVARYILLLTAILLSPVRAAEPEPIRIGLGEAQTGALAAIGKSGILAMQIWVEKINAASGLLGRPVKLITYDTQSNPANVPGIYVKLLDVDHVDFVLSGYSTNMTAPAMPIVIGHKKLFISLFALAVNGEYHDPRVFAMIPVGPEPKRAFSRGFFDIAASLSPKPETLAIIGADAEFARNATDGARTNARDVGLRIVYDSSYPPTTTDFAPVLRSLRATNPDVIYVASYPTDSAGILRAANEMGLKARLFGGSLVGLASAAMKTQLGPLLNGVVLGEQWVPAPKLRYPGVMDFLQTYRARAAEAGVDQLGVFLPPFAYARMQVLEQAVKATGSLDDNKLADFIRSHTFNTVVGDVTYGKDGEWADSRLVWTQFQGIKDNNLSQFMDPATEVVLLPKEARSGALITPYQAGGQ
ncbi:MAG TPA: branched-chain amino acid ABC transporter substrate-binding protein [Acetobacteraceae bacterium]|jgi:branched-chain amino acid transport system substrate-binding protein|nr:branched-chain amino acid ABC transporter substrate-binding protein [Acetobacteraceae bacterium]